MQDAIAELLTLRATDRRRTTSKLSRARVLAEQDGSLHASAAALLLRQARTSAHVYLADNFLWAAFVEACGDDAPVMADVLTNVLTRDPVRGGRDAYLIPNAKLWCEQHMAS